MLSFVSGIRAKKTAETISTALVKVGGVPL